MKKIEQEAINEKIAEQEAKYEKMKTSEQKANCENPKTTEQEARYELVDKQIEQIDDQITMMKKIFEEL